MTARHVRIATLSALVLCFSASMAAAQQREGFWFGVGGGFGSTSVSCTDCDGEREGGATSYLTAGWAATNRLLVGGEFSLWSKSATLEDSVSGQLNLYNVLGTVRFYPSPSSGFFVKGGSGLSMVYTNVDLGGTNVSVDVGKGLALVAGAGYDFHVGKRVSITPVVNGWYGRLGEVKVFDETIAERWKHNVVEFTVGVTFH